MPRYCVIRSDFPLLDRRAFHRPQLSKQVFLHELNNHEVRRILLLDVETLVRLVFLLAKNEC
jgi:hypothetical protein